MPENITVNEAIWRARIRVNILPIVISLALISLSIYLVASFGFENWLIGLTFLVLIPGTVFYRSTMSVRWYIWALNNVRNVHELRQRAIFERILSRTTEQEAFNSKKERELILSLKQKFDTPDEYADDPDIPAQTVIYLARTKRVLMLIIMGICFVAGVTLIAIGQAYIVGCILCAVSGYFIYDSYKIISDNSPQITINNEGITTDTTGFHSWKTVRNEFVGIEGETDRVPFWQDRDRRNGTFFILAMIMMINTKTTRYMTFVLITGRWPSC